MLITNKTQPQPQSNPIITVNTVLSQERERERKDSTGSAMEKACVNIPGQANEQLSQ